MNKLKPGAQMRHVETGEWLEVVLVEDDEAAIVCVRLGDRRNLRDMATTAPERLTPI